MNSRSSYLLKICFLHQTFMFFQYNAMGRRQECIEIFCLFFLFLKHLKILPSPCPLSLLSAEWSAPGPELTGSASARGLQYTAKCFAGDCLLSGPESERTGKGQICLWINQSLWPPHGFPLSFAGQQPRVFLPVLLKFDLFCFHPTQTHLFQFLASHSQSQPPTFPHPAQISSHHPILLLLYPCPKLLTCPNSSSDFSYIETKLISPYYHLPEKEGHWEARKNRTQGHDSPELQLHTPEGMVSSSDRLFKVFSTQLQQRFTSVLAAFFLP